MTSMRAVLSGGVAPEEILVAARTNDKAQLLQHRLITEGVPAVLLAGVDAGDRDAIHVATLHRLKGLEYRHVHLADMSEGTVPLLGAVTAKAEDPVQYEADMTRERALLFVGATRARDSLHITYHGRPSPFLPNAT